MILHIYPKSFEIDDKLHTPIERVDVNPYGHQMTIRPKDDNYGVYFSAIEKKLNGNGKNDNSKDSRIPYIVEVDKDGNLGFIVNTDSLSRINERIGFGHTNGIIIYGEIKSYIDKAKESYAELCKLRLTKDYKQRLSKFLHAITFREKLNPHWRFEATGRATLHIDSIASLVTSGNQFRGPHDEFIEFLPEDLYNLGYGSEVHTNPMAWDNFLGFLSNIGLSPKVDDDKGILSIDALKLHSYASVLIKPDSVNIEPKQDWLNYINEHYRQYNPRIAAYPPTKPPPDRDI